MKKQAKSKEHRNTAVRDIAVLELLFATGVRVSELCALPCENVHLVEGKVKIFGKGAKERYVQITNPDVLATLHCYVETFQKDMEQTGALFVNAP